MGNDEGPQYEEKVNIVPNQQQQPKRDNIDADDQRKEQLNGEKCDSESCEVKADLMTTIG